MLPSSAAQPEANLNNSGVVDAELLAMYSMEKSSLSSPTSSAVMAISAPATMPSTGALNRLGLARAGPRIPQ